MSQNAYNRPQTHFQTLKNRLKSGRCWPVSWDIRGLTRETYDNFVERHSRCSPAQCFVRGERPGDYNVNTKIGYRQEDSSWSSTPSRSHSVARTPIPPVRETSLSPLQYYQEILGDDNITENNPNLHQLFDTFTPTEEEAGTDFPDDSSATSWETTSEEVAEEGAEELSFRTDAAESDENLGEIDNSNPAENENLMPSVAGREAVTETVQEQPQTVEQTQPARRPRTNSTLANTFLENAGLPLYNEAPADNDRPQIAELSKITSAAESGTNSKNRESQINAIINSFESRTQTRSPKITRSNAVPNLQANQDTNNGTKTPPKNPAMASSKSTFASEDIRAQTEKQRFDQLLTLHENQAKSNNEMTNAINRLTHSMLNMSDRQGNTSTDGEDSTSFNTSFFGSNIDPSKEYDIFKFVINAANTAAKADKEMSLMKKFKNINECDLPIWDKNKHPSCLNFLMNVYHSKLSRLPAITPFEVTAFTYLAFDHSMKERIMRQTSMLAEYYVKKEVLLAEKSKAGQPLVDDHNLSLKLGRLDFKTVKLIFYPQLAQTIQSGVLDLKVEAWNTSAGVALTDHFLEVLMMTQINNSTQMQEASPREMSMAFKELLRSLKDNDHLEVYRELSRNTTLCRMQAMKLDRLGAKVTVQEAIREIEDCALVAEINPAASTTTTAVTTEQAKCAATTTEADINFINRSNPANTKQQNTGGNMYYQQPFQPTTHPMMAFLPHYQAQPYPPMAMTPHHQTPANGQFFQAPAYTNMQLQPAFNQQAGFQPNFGQNKGFGQKNYSTPRGKFFQDNRARMQALHSTFASHVATCNMATIALGQEADIQTCQGELEIDFDETEATTQTAAGESQGPEVECSTINWRKFGFMLVKMRLNTSKASDQYVRCLLDCGSDISIIKPGILQHHGVDKFVYPIANSVQCTGFNNSKSTLSNQVQLFTTMGQIKAKFMFFVGPPNMSNDCIIGMDILDKLGIPKVILEQCYRLKIPVEVNAGLKVGKYSSVACQTDIGANIINPASTLSPTATKRLPTSTGEPEEGHPENQSNEGTGLHADCRSGWLRDWNTLVGNLLHIFVGPKIDQKVTDVSKLDYCHNCDIKNKISFLQNIITDLETNKITKLTDTNNENYDLTTKTLPQDIIFDKKLHQNEIKLNTSDNYTNSIIEINETKTNADKIFPHENNTTNSHVSAENNIKNDICTTKKFCPKEKTTTNSFVSDENNIKNTTNTTNCGGKSLKLGVERDLGEINKNSNSVNLSSDKPKTTSTNNSKTSQPSSSSLEGKPIRNLIKNLNLNQKVLLSNLIDLDTTNKWDVNYSLSEAKNALINHSHAEFEVEDPCRINIGAAETTIIPANNYSFVKINMPPESYGRNWSLSGFKKGPLEIPDRTVFAGNAEETAVYCANHSDHPVKIHKGQRIVKAVLLKNVIVPSFEMSDEVEKRKLVFSDAEIAEVLSVWEFASGKELCQVKPSPFALVNSVTRFSNEINADINVVTKLEEASAEDLEKIKSDETQYKQKRDQAFMDLIKDLPKELKNCFMRHKDRFDGDESSWRLMKIRPLVLPRQPNHTRHVKCSYRKRFTEPEQAVIDDFIVTSLARKLITRSNSNILSPLLIVPKPHGRGYRVCCDYRLVNQRVYDYNSHAIPEIQDIIAKVSNKAMHTCLDITSAYWRAPLADDGINRETTAFVVTQGQFVGVYHWNVLPFGPKPAVSLFSRIMDDALRGLQHHGITYYLDDICCSSGTPGMTESEVISQHAEDLDRLFRRARATNLTFSIEKAIVGKQYIELVGLFLGNGQVRASKDTINKMVKAQDAVDLDQPLKTFMSLLGLMNYSRKFIPKFSKGHKIIRTIKNDYDSLKKDKSKSSSEIAEVKAKGQVEIKKILVEWSDAVTTTALTIPTADQELEIHTDASADRLGWVCRIKESGRIVEFGSREFSDCEKRYTIMEREMLALCEALEKLKMYCHRSPHNHCFIDNQCAVAHLNSGRTETTSRAMRFLLRINCTPNTSFNYVATSQNPADCLSRDLKITTIEGDTTTEETQPTTTEETSKQPTLTTGTQAGPLDVSEVTRRRLEMIHEDHGHPGQNRLTKLSKLMFPFMSLPHQLVKSVVDNCASCVKARRLGSASAIGKMYVPSGPNEIIHIDHFDPSGKDAIHRREAVLSCRDSFSKFSSLYPCRGHSHSEICEILRNHIMLFGAPSKIRLDNALNSKTMRNLAELYGFEIVPVPALSPKTNGQVERIHSDIRKILPLTIANLKLRKDNWVDALPRVTNILNTTPHTVTLVAPDQVQLGHSCLDILRPKLRQQWKEIADRIKAAQDKAARPQAGPFKETTLSPGQAIWIFPDKSPPVAAEVLRDLGKSVFVRKCDDSLTRHREISYDKERISIRL